MANIDTSNMELNPYVPQAKPAKQEFLVIIPIRMTEVSTENTQAETTQPNVYAEIMRPTAQNIHASVQNYIDQSNIYDSITYDYIYFNTDNYFLVPLKRFNLPTFDISFIEEENSNQIGGQYFSDLPNDTIEGSWYILHHIPIEVTDNEYFTPTGVYIITPNDLPMPDISAWEPQVTPVSQNTIINAEDDITSYIYTENGWEVFANNMTSITDSETELFIRGLVYGEDVEPHEDEGGTIVEEEGGGTR